MKLSQEVTSPNRASHYVGFIAALAIWMFAASATETSAEVIGAYIGGTQRTDGGIVVGATFNSFGQTISSLGFYDFGIDGLATSYQLGLWDASQTLIATATVTPTSTLIGEFRYASIAPVTIGTFATPQAFTIGALLPSIMPDIWLENALLVLGVGFTGAGTGQYLASGTLVYPTTFDDSPYVVVNAGGPVPEPSSLALASLGFGLLTICVRRRRVSQAIDR